MLFTIQRQGENMTFRQAATIISLAMTALPAMASQGQAQAPRAEPAARSKPVRTGYVLASGVNYFFEVHGRGAPLLLLHGGLGSIDMFGPVHPAPCEGAAGHRGRSPRPRSHRPWGAADQPYRDG